MNKQETIDLIKKEYKERFEQLKKAIDENPTESLVGLLDSNIRGFSGYREDNFIPYSLKTDELTGQFKASLMSIYRVRTLFRHITEKIHHFNSTQTTYNDIISECSDFRDSPDYFKKVQQVCSKHANKAKKLANQQLNETRSIRTIDEMLDLAVDGTKLAQQPDLHHHMEEVLRFSNVLNWYAFFNSRELDVSHVDFLIEKGSYHNRRSTLNYIQLTGFKVTNEVIEKYHKQLDFKGISTVRLKKIPKNLRVQLQLSGKL